MTMYAAFQHITNAEVSADLPDIRRLALVSVGRADRHHGDRLALPPPGSVRAFHMDGTVGVVLRRGTWHALRRFPVGAPLIDIVLLT
jgi:hypothetical protein